MTTGRTIALTLWTFVGKVMTLLWRDIRLLIKKPRKWPQGHGPFTERNDSEGSSLAKKAPQGWAHLSWVLQDE